MTTTNDIRTITEVSGTGVAVRGNDIDTDRVIPARFMKEVTFENMGEYAFYDARRDDDGELNEHPFNRFTDASILVVNQNFGCGSSREHAPQALMRWGIEGIIGESFAEIFAGNCQAIGIPTVTAETEDVQWIMQQIEADPDKVLHVDVARQTVTVGDRTISVNVNESQKEALQQGNWDTTALLKSSLDQVQEIYRRLPYTSGFADSRVERSS